MERFHIVGMRRETTEIMFHQRCFNVKFHPQFGGDLPNPNGDSIPISDFFDMLEYSNQQNPGYIPSEYCQLALLENKIKERCSCPITRGMRIAYEDILEEISKCKNEIKESLANLEK